MDIILRVYSIYFNTFEYNFINELILSCFSTVQFYLLNNIFQIIFKDEHYDGKESLEIKSPIFFCAIFYPLSFTFEISNSFSLIQYIIGIFAVLIYSYYIQTRVSLYLDNIEKKYASIGSKNILVNLPYFIALYFVIFFAFRICSLFIEHKLYYSYILMACDIFKEVGKYLTFGLVVFLIKSFNKYIKNEEIEIPVKKGKGGDFNF